MLKLIRLLFLFILLPSLSVAQKYAHSTYLGYAEDSGAGIYDIDSEGNAYTAIASRYDIQFGDRLFQRHGAFDYAVIGKLNSAGKILWSRMLSDDNGNYQISDIKVDANFNIYISGSGSNIKLDDGSILQAGTFLIKLDKNGRTLWGIISENTSNMSSLPGGLIALAGDGVYWSGSFYGYLHLQGRVINTNNPNMGTPDAFVARVSANGTVKSIYHDPALSAIVQVLVQSDNGKAAAVVSRGGWPKAKVVLNDIAQSISDDAFLMYGDFPPPMRATSTGYQMVGTLYEWLSWGANAKGLYDTKFDRQLNVVSSVKLSDPPPAGRTIYNAIAYNDKGYFFNSPPNPYSIENHLNWLYLDENKDYKVLPDENVNTFGDDPITRTFVKVVGDTLHMVVRHLSYYTTSFTFDHNSYSTPSNLDETYFWVKYVLDDADSCKKIKAQIVQNGIEGSKDVKIKLWLPQSCPATEDVHISLGLRQPDANEHDLTLPAEAIIRQGESEAMLDIPVTNDAVMEELETFILELSENVNETGYIMSSASKNLPFTITDDDNTPQNRQLSIVYTPQIKEGASGNISAALPAGVTASVPITLALQKSTVNYPATEGVDFEPFTITIPAGSNGIQVDVKALTDYMIEGDEEIKGDFSVQNSTLGTFTSATGHIKITIDDKDNLPENRLFEIIPADDIIKEGTTQAYTFKLIEPYKVQNPVTITTTHEQWLAEVAQSALSVTYNSEASTITFTYPDDRIIRKNKVLKLLIEALGENTGKFQFKWKNNITDTLSFTAIDNDADYARLELLPQALSINEGSSTTINIKIAGDRILEDDLALHYQYQGIGIATDQRILKKLGTAVLKSGQNNVNLILPVTDNQEVDLNNQYILRFSVDENTTGITPLFPDNTASVLVIDDDYDQLIIPNAFTPNGDGINDAWEIKNLPYDIHCRVSVFNRYGETVYNSLGYPKPWDGRLNGKDAAAGSYYYIISSYGKTYSGSLTIIR